MNLKKIICDICKEVRFCKKFKQLNFCRECFVKEFPNHKSKWRFATNGRSHTTKEM